MNPFFPRRWLGQDSDVVRRAGARLPKKQRTTVTRLGLEQLETRLVPTVPTMAGTFNGTIASNICFNSTSGTYEINGNLTIASGATLTIQSGVNVQIDQGVTITVASGATLAVNGAASFAAQNYNNNVAEGITVNGTMTVSNTSFTTLNSGYANDNSIIQVSSGGHLTASGSTFGWTNFILANGSTLNSGDITGNTFNTTVSVPVTDVPLLSNNLSFHDVDINAGNLPSGQSITLSPMGTSSTLNQRFIFPGAFTIQQNATLSIAANSTVLIREAQGLTDSGTLNVTSPAQFAIENFNDNSGEGITVNGTMTISNTSFTTINAGYANDNSSITVNAGGHLTASNSTFGWTNFSLANGSTLNSGDITGNTFNTTVSVPITDVPLLANNLSFQDVDINAGNLASGQSVTLNPLGTSNTINQRYVFPGAFTIQANASLTVSTNSTVLIRQGQTITDSGTLNITSPALFAIENFSNNVPEGITVNGTMTVSNTSFTSVNAGYVNDNTNIQVNAGAHLTASNSTFDWDQLILANGSVLNSGDMTGNTFNTTVFVPVTDVPLLANNLSFQDVDINAGNLASGQSVTLNPLGTSNTINQRYVFPGAFTIQPNATLTVGTNSTVLIRQAQTITDSGTLNISSPALFAIENFSDNVPEGITVNGTMTVSNTSFTSVNGGYVNDNTNIQVNAGGHLTSSNSTFGWDQFSLANGCILNSGDITGNSFNTTLYVPITDVPLLANNLTFLDIDINGGTLPAGQVVTLAPLGTQSTINQRYVFPAAFTIAAGAALDVASNATVLIRQAQTITDSGTLNITSPALFAIENFSDNVPEGITVNGTMTLSNTSFTSVNGGYVNDNTNIQVNAGGHLTASNSDFGWDQFYLVNGSILDSGDLTGNAFDTTVYVPIADVPLLANNLRFQDVDINANSTTAPSMTLAQIGTQTTAGLRYVFPGSFTVQQGTTLNIGAGTNILIRQSQTLTVNGALNITNPSSFAIENFSNNSPEGITVNGILTVNNASLTTVNGGYQNDTSSITVNSGASFTGANSALAWSNLTLNAGSSTTLSAVSFRTQLDINSSATINIANDDFTNATVVAYPTTGASGSTINLPGNYWGSTNANQISTLITDNHKNSNLPTVSYSPFLSQVIISNPSNQVFSAGQTALITAAALGVPSPTVQWYVQTGGTGPFNSIPNATNTTLILPNVTIGMNGNVYEAIFTNGGTPASVTSSTATLSVVPVPTSVSLTALPNPSTFGQSVTLTATVTPTSSGPDTLSGMVAFMDGTTVLGQAAPNGSGQASITVSTLPPGTQIITATYQNDPIFATSSANNSLNPLVVQDGTTTTVTNSPTPSTYGSSVTFTATVTAHDVSAGVPAGTVTFTEGATTLAALVPVDGTGHASFSTTNLAVGSHTITATFVPNTGWIGSSGTNGSTPKVISPATLTVTANAVSRQYGQSDPTFTYSITGFQNGQTLATSGVTGSASLSGNDTATSPQGAYTITATKGTLAAANYNFTLANGILTVTKAHLTVTASNASRLYGGVDPTFGVTITGFVNGDTASVVSGSAGITSGDTASSPAGTYAITPNLGTLSAGNYDFTVFNPGTLTINKAHLTVTANPQTRLYGQADPTLTATVSGFQNGQTLATSGVTGSAALNSNDISTSPVGSYTITASAGTLTAANYDFTAFNTGTLTVNKAHLTVTATNASRLYGAADPAFGVTFSGFQNGDTAGVISGSASITSNDTAGSPFGGYTITPALGTLSAANYDFTVFNTGTLSVLKNHLTVTANPASRLYGAADPTFTVTISGFLNGDTVSSVTGTAGFTTTDTATSPVGSYTITPSAGTLSAPNYDFTVFNTGALTVNKAHLTVTASAASRPYGGSDPVFTATLSGFANGDTASVVTGSAALTSNDNVFSPVQGTYTISPAQGTLSATNYDFTTFKGAALTITKAPLTVTANPATRLYGAADPTLTATLSGFLNGDTASVVSGSASLSSTDTVTSPVGTYTITPTAGTLTAANYSFTVFNTGTLTVNKAHLTVTANGISRHYGAADPTFAVAISGFKNSDTVSVVGGQASITSTDTLASPVGTYTITPSLGTLTASNYDFTVFNPGTLTVTKAYLTVTATSVSRLYGAADPSFGVTFSGLVNGDTSSVIGGAAAITSNDTVASPAGTYTITPTVGTLTASNYSFTTFKTGTLTVTKANLSVSAVAASRTYGAADPTYAVTYSGFVNGDTNSVVSGAAAITSNDTVTSPVGAYTITPKVGTLTATNYAFVFQTAALTVTKAPLTVTANAASRSYGSADPNFSATFSGFKNGETASVVSGQASFSSTDTLTSPVGTYPITPALGTLSATNYAFTVFNAGTLTVTPVLTASTATIPLNAITLTLSGQGFDTNPANDAVTFSNGVTGTVTGALGTQLTVSNVMGLTLGLALDASVTVDGFSSGPQVQVATVGAAQFGTTTAVTANPAAPVTGQSVTFTVTVMGSAAGTAVPTGTVTFTEGTTTLAANVPINASGQATYSTGALGLGSYTITASFSGTNGWQNSTGTSPTVPVKYGTTTSVVTAASTNPASPVYGQSLTFTAGVTNTLGVGGAPTGSVTFYNGTTALGTRTLASGVATLTLTTLPAGTDTITATYLGAGNFAGSSSPSALAQTVAAASTTTTVTASPSPATLGQAVTLTATVANASGTGVVPTGTVTFKEVINGVTTTLGTRSLVNGVATFTTSSLASGSYTIEAFYNVTSDFLASSGNVLETIM